MSEMGRRASDPSIGSTSDATNGRTRQALPKSSFAFHLSEVIPQGQVKQVNHRLQAREQAIEKEEKETR